MVDEVVNNQQNWNGIDDVVISSSIVSPYLLENNRNEEKEELNDSSRMADDKVDKAINNRYNWNAIDIILCSTPELARFVSYCPIGQLQMSQMTKLKSSNSDSNLIPGQSKVQRADWGV